MLKFIAVFIAGFISFPICEIIINKIRKRKELEKELDRIKAMWVESFEETENGIKLLSKDNNVIDIIPKNSKFTFESGIKFTILGDALLMAFLLKGGKKVIKGPYYIKRLAANKIRSSLSEGYSEFRIICGKICVI